VVADLATDEWLLIESRKRYYFYLAGGLSLIDLSQHNFEWLSTGSFQLQMFMQNDIFHFGKSLRVCLVLIVL